MNTLDTVLTQIFDRRAETAQIEGAVAGARLTREAEAEAIRGVKEGDSDAIVTLLFAYAPALRGAVARYRETLGEDARMVAVGAVVEACHKVADGDFLAGVLVDYLTDALASAAATQTLAFTVPSRTVKRFLGILRRADGDVAAAADLAPQHNMTRETFYAVLSALGADSLDGEQGDEDASGALVDRAAPLWETPDTEEDRVLCEAAFLAVDDLERDVVRVKYGFEGDAFDRTLSDDATVHALSTRDLGEAAVLDGQTVISRQKVQRTHASALGKMREALGA